MKTFKHFSFLTGFAAATLVFALLSFGKTKSSKNINTLHSDSSAIYLKTLERVLEKREAHEMQLLHLMFYDAENTDDLSLTLKTLDHLSLRIYRMDHHNQLYDIRNTTEYAIGDRLPDSLMKVLEEKDQRFSIITAGAELIIYYENSKFLEDLKVYNSKH